MRRRVPDLSAVQLCHAFLTARLAPGGLYVDATCGNGHDTQFLCTLLARQGTCWGWIFNGRPLITQTRGWQRQAMAQWGVRCCTTTPPG